MPDLTAAQVFRDFVTDGVPSSGANKPKKADIRKWGKWVEDIITAFTSNGGLIYSSKAAMDADLAHAANSMAWVVGDPVAANNGVYGKVGASGTGSWTRRSDLPFSFIIASDVGAGTPNAIQATTSIPVSASALIWMNIFEANTGSPVTVSFNGGEPLTVKTNSGSNISAGGLTAGMIVLGIVSGSTFRILNDQVSSAIIAQAESFANIAQAAANGNLVFPDRADAQAATIDAAIHSVTLKGDVAEGDGDGGLFVDVNNGSGDTFTDAGGRTFYRAPDVSFNRLNRQLETELELLSDPSTRFEDWDNPHMVMFRALETRSQNRVVPHQYLKFGNTSAVLAVTRHFDPVGKGPNLETTTWGTSLFFSEDLERWREGRNNPIFNQIEYAWQGQRAMGQALVWDHQQQKWALFFSADGTAAIQAPPYNSQGTRAVGLARSANLVNGSWEINPDPVLLVESADIITWYGEGGIAGDVYCCGVPRWFEEEGLWYMPVAVGAGALSNQPFKTGLITAATLDGPWSSIANNPILAGDGGWESYQIVGNSWWRVRNTYWMSYHGRFGGIGLAHRTVGFGETLDGPWERTSSAIINPTFTHDRTVLVPTPFGWRIISSSDNGGQDLIVSWAERSASRSLASDPIGGQYSWPLGYIDGRYYYPLIGKIGSQTFTVTPGTYYAAPIQITKPVRTSALVGVITTGVPGFCVFGVYTNNNGRPGEYIIQSPERPTDNAGTLEPGLDVIINPGLYWMVSHFSAACTVRSFSAGDSMADAPYGWFSADPTSLSGHGGWAATGTYSSTLPAFYPAAAGASAANLPRIGFKAQSLAV